MAQKKKKKKNFKGVTGIKFNDLILPLVLGGVGSYSNAAGRGVNLGLQAFRTLQAGREFQAERDLGVEQSENLSGYADSLRQQAEALNIPEEEFTQVLQEEATKERVLPTEGQAPETVQVDLEALYGKGDNMAAQPGATFAEQFGLVEPTVAGAEEQQLEQQAAVVEQEGAAQGEDYAGAILGAKKLRDQQAKDLGILQDRITFYDQMAGLSKVNPSSAGYLIGQEMLGRARSQQSLDQIAATGIMYAENNADKSRREALAQAAKHGHVMAEIRLRAELEPEFTPFQGPFGLINVWKKGPLAGKMTDADNNIVTQQQIQAAINNSNNPQIRDDWRNGYFASWQDYVDGQKMLADGQIGQEEVNSAKAIWMSYWNGMPPWMKQKMAMLYESGKTPVPPPGYEGDKKPEQPNPLDIAANNYGVDPSPYIVQ